MGRGPAADGYIKLAAVGPEWAADVKGQHACMIPGCERFGQ